MLSASKANNQPNASINLTKAAQKATADHSKDFEVDNGPKKAEERETDVHRITQRLKQVEFGKNTLGKRAFDGEVKKWRRLLHEWDPPGEAEEEQGDDPEGMHTPGGRKRTRGAGSNKACSPDENAAPKRQTLSGGSAGEDLYGGWEEDEVQL